MQAAEINSESCGRLTDRGYNMTTFSGLPFWPLAPLPEDIRIVDIAHSLSMQCRYNGHTTSFYSVAQHSVLASRYVPKEFALEALLHDAQEGLGLGDMIRPVKLLMSEYKVIEDKLEAAVRKRFNLPPTMSPEVKIADTRMCWTEKRDLLTHSGLVDWGPAVEPYPDAIIAWNPPLSKRLFLQRYEVLTGDPVSY